MVSLVRAALSTPPDRWDPPDRQVLSTPLALAALSTPPDRWDPSDRQVLSTPLALAARRDHRQKVVVIVAASDHPFHSIYELWPMLPLLVVVKATCPNHLTQLVLGGRCNGGIGYPRWIAHAGKVAQ